MIEITYSQECKLTLKEQQITLTQTGIQFNDNNYIKYENVTMIGISGQSIMLCLKAEGQEDDDDNQLGYQIIQQLRNNEQGINVQGSLTIQLWIDNQQTFVQEFKKLQQNHIQEKPLEQILSSDEDDDVEDNEQQEQQNEDMEIE